MTTTDKRLPVTLPNLHTKSDTDGEPSWHKVSAAIVVAFLCGFAELLGYQIANVGTLIADYPWTSSSIGGAAIVTVATLRPGKTYIPSLLRRVLRAIEGSV